MDVRRATSEFVLKGAELFHLIRSEGDALTATDIHMLRTQLQVLDIEVSNLQTFRELDGDKARHRLDKSHR